MTAASGGGGAALSLTDLCISRIAVNAKAHCDRLGSLPEELLERLLELLARRNAAGLEEVLLSTMTKNTAKLSISECTSLRKSTLRQAGRLSPHLVELNLVNCNIVNSVAKAFLSFCPRLRLLRLDGSARLSDAFLDANPFALAGGLLSLEAISLSRCPQITDGTILSLVKICPSLRCVDLSHCRAVTDIGVEQLLTVLPNLSKLDVSHCDKISDACIPPTTTSSTTSSSTASSRSSSSSPTLPSLKCVSFAKTRITDIAVIRLAEAAPSLENVNFSFCGGVTDRAIEILVANCPRLGSITLQGCSGVTDRAVQAIAKHLPSLQSLDLSFSLRVSLASVRFLQQAAPPLTEVNLSLCSFVSPPPRSTDSNDDNTCSHDDDNEEHMRYRHPHRDDEHGDDIDYGYQHVDRQIDQRHYTGLDPSVHGQQDNANNQEELIPLITSAVGDRGRDGDDQCNRYVTSSHPTSGGRRCRQTSSASSSVGASDDDDDDEGGGCANSVEAVDRVRLETDGDDQRRVASSNNKLADNDDDDGAAVGGVSYDSVSDSGSSSRGRRCRGGAVASRTASGSSRPNDADGAERRVNEDDGGDDEKKERAKALLAEAVARNAIHVNPWLSDLRRHYLLDFGSIPQVPPLPPSPYLNDGDDDNILAQGMTHGDITYAPHHHLENKQHLDNRHHHHHLHEENFLAPFISGRDDDGYAISHHPHHPRHHPRHPYNQRLSASTPQLALSFSSSSLASSLSSFSSSPPPANFGISAERSRTGEHDDDEDDDGDDDDDEIQEDKRRRILGGQLFAQLIISLKSTLRVLKLDGVHAISSPACLSALAKCRSLTSLSLCLRDLADDEVPAAAASALRQHHQQQQLERQRKYQPPEHRQDQQQHPQHQLEVNHQRKQQPPLLSSRTDGAVRKHRSSPSSSSLSSAFVTASNASAPVSLSTATHLSCRSTPNSTDCLSHEDQGFRREDDGRSNSVHRRWRRTIHHHHHHRRRRACRTAAELRGVEDDDYHGNREVVASTVVAANDCSGKPPSSLSSSDSSQSSESSFDHRNENVCRRSSSSQTIGTRRVDDDDDRASSKKHQTPMTSLQKEKNDDDGVERRGSETLGDEPCCTVASSRRCGRGGEHRTDEVIHLKEDDDDDDDDASRCCCGVLSVDGRCLCRRRLASKIEERGGAEQRNGTEGERVIERQIGGRSSAADGNGGQTGGDQSLPVGSSSRQATERSRDGSIEMLQNGTSRDSTSSTKTTTTTTAIRQSASSLSSTRMPSMPAVRDFQESANRNADGVPTSASSVTATTMSIDRSLMVAQLVAKLGRGCMHLRELRLDMTRVTDQKGVALIVSQVALHYSALENLTFLCKGAPSTSASSCLLPSSSSQPPGVANAVPTTMQSAVGVPCESTSPSSVNRMAEEKDRVGGGGEEGGLTGQLLLKLLRRRDGRRAAKLRQLTLHNPTSIDGNFFSKNASCLSRVLSDIDRLSIFGNHNFTDKTISDIVECMPLVRHLQFIDCPRLTPHAFDFIAKHSKAVKSLHIVSSSFRRRTDFTAK